jgi:Flp pilus assembly protein TadD
VNQYANREVKSIQGAEHLWAAGLQDEALALSERLLRDHPASIDAAVVLAHLAERAGRTERARAAGRHALALDPNNRVIRSLLERLPGER